METARLVRDYVDTLAWPVVVLVLVALFVFLFRHQIAELIKRITGVSGPGGARIDISPQAAAELPEGPTGGALDAALQEAEAKVQQHQQSATYYYVLWLFENIYRVAYGTQLGLLFAARSSGTNGLDEETVKVIFERHLELVRKTLPEYQYSFALYIGFLNNNGLVTIAARYHITDTGRAFLNWMSLQSLSHTQKAW